MKRMMMFAMLLVAMALAGCMHNKWRAEEAESYVNAQEKAIAAQKPIVSFEAAEGQVIELRGVKKFEVYAPTNARVLALPQQRSGFWGFAEKALVTGGRYLLGHDALKFGSDFLTRAFDGSGDHSQTTINIEDSYNDQSDQSEHGDTYTDSQHIAGPVAGPGAGIGNALDIDESTHQEGDGSAFGDENTIRNESPGPIQEDNSDPGDDCTGGADCSDDDTEIEDDDP
ncbi:MAG: hypothetical protein HYV17_07980 [Xanthomonadales bacterium]|nr:hypothetical protein [Xanthomonadales bacterium]